jgi:uncharacterized protein YegP (UPF0339 family)
MQNTFPTYWISRDDKGRWTWKFLAADGDFIAQSSKKYPSQQECGKAIKLLRESTSVAIFATIDDVEIGPAVETKSEDSKAEPLELSASQMVSDSEEEAEEPADAPAETPAAGGKSPGDLVNIHFRRLQRESGTKIADI